MDEKQLEAFCVRAQGLSNERILELLDMAVRAGAKPGYRIKNIQARGTDDFSISSQWAYVGINERLETDVFLARNSDGLGLMQDKEEVVMLPRVVTISWIRSYLGSLCDRERIN